MTDLHIEPTGDAQFGPCPCCGFDTRRVWGFVHNRDATIASYFVNWTPSRPDHDAVFDLAIGKWGDGTTPADRSVVSLAYRPSKASFMIIDAAERPMDFAAIASHRMSRDRVIGTPLADQAFAIVDAVWLRDDRIAEITGWQRGDHPI